MTWLQDRGPVSAASRMPSGSDEPCPEAMWESCGENPRVRSAAMKWSSTRPQCVSTWGIYAPKSKRRAPNESSGGRKTRATSGFGFLLPREWTRGVRGIFRARQFVDYSTGNGAPSNS